MLQSSFMTFLAIKDTWGICKQVLVVNVVNIMETHARRFEAWLTPLAANTVKGVSPGNAVENQYES